MKIELACVLPGEAPRLHAAITDFGEHGARSDYAAWLEAEGATEKATQVRATIDAYGSLDATVLAESESGSWQQMIGTNLLRFFADLRERHERAEVERLRDFVVAHLRPSVAITGHEPIDDDQAVGASKMWGSPDIQADQQWPRVAECSSWSNASDSLPPDDYCGFVGQLAFADLAGTVVAQELPPEGGLSVFVYVDVNIGVTEAVLRTWQSTAGMQRMPTPQAARAQAEWDDLLEYPAHGLLAREELSLPGFEDGPYERTFEALGLGEGIRSEVEDILWWLVAEDAQPCPFGIGGYQPFTPTGGDPLPNTDSLRLVGLQTRPSGAGLFYAISTDELQAGRLDRSKLVWAEWD